MSAVHDGGGAAGAAAMAGGSAPGDSAGIALDAVRDVGGGLGWGCTQALPDQPPSHAESEPEVAAAFAQVRIRRHVQWTLCVAGLETPWCPAPLFSLFEYGAVPDSVSTAGLFFGCS